MDPLDIAGLGVDAFKLGYNIYTNKRDFDYQKALQQTMFEREDTAVQRRMADLKAAGLNPSLANGSAAGAGAVVSRSNTNDLGSALDTVQAINSIRSQKQQVQNARIEQSILEKKNTEEHMNQQLQLAETMKYLGLPFDTKVNISNGKFNFKVGLGDWENKSDGEWHFNQNMSPLNDLFEYNLNSQKNAADILQKDNDYYTADKITGYLSSLLPNIGFSFGKRFK